MAEQERIAREMTRLGMRMGVFVAHTIHWREPNLAGGDEAKRAEFLTEIRASVDVAMRVNATWMTVVPGHVDLRLHPDYQTANVVESLRRACDILEPHGKEPTTGEINYTNVFRHIRAKDSPESSGWSTVTRGLDARVRSP